MKARETAKLARYYRNLSRLFHVGRKQTAKRWRRYMHWSKRCLHIEEVALAHKTIFA